MADENVEAKETNESGSPNGEPSQRASGADETEKLRARLREAETNAASLREKEKERERRLKEKVKKEEEKKALDRGEHERVIENLRQKITEQEKLVDAFNKATDERINAEIDKLPEDMKAEVEFVREQGLDREKLEQFVRMKMKTIGNAESMDSGVPGPPAPSAAAGSRRRPEDPLHEDTKTLLNELMAPETVYEIGRQIGHFDIGTNGDQKFRFMATGDDNEDTRRWIRFVQAGAVDPFREQREARLKRVKALKESIR